MTIRDPAIEACDAMFPDCVSEIRFFYYLTPANDTDLRSDFFASRCEADPGGIEYRPLEFSAATLRGRLDEAPVGEIGDGVLRTLYSEKRWELDMLVSLLEARGSRAFRGLSLELFGRPPAALILEAKDLLAAHLWIDDDSLEAEDVVDLLHRHIDAYRCRYRDFDCEVVLDDATSAKMYVSENRIHVKRGATFSRPAALCDVVHEIDAHVLTYLNGSEQPYRLFEIGPRGTMAFQESLGVFTEVANGVMYPGRAIVLAARVVAVEAMLAGADFTEVYRMLTVDHGIDREGAFGICLRVFRGGGFSKDWVYLAEVESIVRRVAGGEDPGTLLLGKVTMDTLDAVDDLLARGLLEPPRFLPPYLEDIAIPSSKMSVKSLDSGSATLHELLLGPLQSPR